MTGCIIVASGPSAKGFIPPTDVPVMAVNGAIDWLPRADYWFTLDPSKANIDRMHRQKPGTEYYAALYLTRVWFALPDGLRVLHRISDRGEEPKPKGSPEWWLWRWSCIPTMSDNKAQINTGNSAWGAVQLARHLGYKRIALVGVDASSSERCEGGKPNNLSHLPLLFDNIPDDIQVVNCGLMKSSLPKMGLQDAIKWTQYHE